MSDKSTQPRLWRTLGLGAAIVLASGPAAALSPASDPAPDAQLWQAQADGGEGGEAAAPETGEAGESGEGGTSPEAGEAGEAGASPAAGEGGESSEAGEAGEGAEASETGETGEAGAAGAEGGEAGEAGEGGALAAEDPVVAILTGLSLVEGHLRSGMDAEDAEGSAMHMAHPGEELLEDLAPLLEAQGLPGLDAEIEALEHASHGGDPQAAFDAALARIGAIRTALGASPAQRFEAMTAVLRQAAEEYGEGVSDGAVANLEEYQDARGFVAAVRAEAEGLAGSEDPGVADAAGDVLAALAETDAAFPGVSPRGGLPADGAELLHGAAARIELAALALP